MKLPNTCSVPVKIPSIDSNDNPAVQEALIVLLKLSYVLILAFGHFSPSISQPSLEMILLPRNTRHFSLSNQAITTRLGSSLQTGQFPTWRMKRAQKKILNQNETISMHLPFILLKHAGKALNIIFIPYIFC